MTDRARKGLLLYPEFPDSSFWSYRHIMPMVGAKAAFLNSTQGPDERRRVEAAFLAGELDLLYLAPERLPVAAGYLVEVGPAIGAHAGPGTLVVGLQPAP